MSDQEGSRGTIRGGAVALALGALLVLPGAASADVRVADFRAELNASERKFFEAGGLSLRASCSPSGDIDFDARTNADGALIAVNRQTGEDGNLYFEDSVFDTTDADFILSGVDDNVSGQLVYANPNGKITTMDWLAEDGNNGDSVPPHGGAWDCAFQGIGRKVDPGSVSRVKFTKTEGTPVTSFFKLGGLELTASCQPDGGDGGTESDMEVDIKSTKDDATVHWNLQTSNMGGYDEEDALDTGQTLPFLSPGSGDDESAGQIVYSRPGGVNVTVDWAAQVTPAGNLLGDKDCAFVGTARKRVQGDDLRLNHRFVADEPDKTFAKGGLQLISSCDASDLDTLARSQHGNAVVHFNQQGLDPPTTFYAEEDNFDMGALNEIVFFDQLMIDADSLAGQIIYGRASGKVVTVDYLAEEGAYGVTKDCAFVGTAEVAEP